MSFISNILSFIEELHNNLPPAEAGFYLLEIQGFPPTAFGELHNVIPNPVAETWVVKLVVVQIRSIKTQPTIFSKWSSEGFTPTFVPAIHQLDIGNGLSFFPEGVLSM